MIGESPTGPGIFQARPLVVVTRDISPLAFKARQLIVPVGGRTAISQAQASVASSAAGNISLRRKPAAALPGASRPVVQLLCPLGSRSDRFHTSQARRDFSVSRFSSANPNALATRSAPSPASMMWSDSAITNLAIFDGVLMPRIEATDPARRVGPCTTQAS